ncbi:hypothetical protein H8K35_17985 [Undibacterium sp. LX40W]|uniref:FecR family protein n=1 Tax=Undibacterium nitidum TaxID=2762298 RepID=A0A923HSQ1_9BURK|nr:MULTISPECIES: hypothetical protein [Undibacterium]MBC3883283.1 hypothetical protein [Undibacterium nitidum]MBC3893570.1 hypothetical protein [Undibacterium sp. LX40W]
MKKLAPAFIAALLLMQTVYAMAQQTANVKDPSIGIVLDLQGQAKVLDQAQGRKLQLLSYLKQNEQVQLEQGAKLSVSLYANRSVYRFVGPAVLVAEKDQIRLIKGAAPEVKQVKEKLVAGAESGQLLTGAIRMRQLPPKIAVLTPENGAVLLGAPKELNWASVEKANYEIRIVDEDENLIIEAQSASQTWMLPAALQFASGKAYKWNVSFISERDGARYSTSGEFRLADETTRIELSKLRPTDDAVIEEWVLYAAHLQSLGLFQEARATWKRIGQTRPDLERSMESK